MTYLLKDHSLKNFNTLQLDATAAFVYLVFTIDDLVSVLKEKHQKNILIGKGSNIFLKKDYYDESYAFIVTHHMNHIEIKENEIIVSSGLSLNDLAWITCQKSIKGYAFCEDIPGTLGGALMMNAGQYEFTIGQYVNWVDVYNIETHEIEHIVPDELFFSYRHSSFHKNQIILQASLKKEMGIQEEILDQIYTYKKNRFKKQPREFANAGSVFKRPQKNGESLYVWKLLEACELRGYKIGDASVSAKHPGFIVNEGHASTSDVSALLDLCQSRVKEKFDVDLELEWKVIE